MKAYEMSTRDYDAIEREALRLRSQATAELMTGLREWLTARRRARHAVRTARMRALVA